MLRLLVKVIEHKTSAHECSACYSGLLEQFERALLELLGAEHVRQVVLARYSGLLSGSESSSKEKV